MVTDVWSATAGGVKPSTRPPAYGARLTSTVREMMLEVVEGGGEQRQFMKISARGVELFDGDDLSKAEEISFAHIVSCETHEEGRSFSLHLVPPDGTRKFFCHDAAQAAGCLARLCACDLVAPKGSPRLEARGGQAAFCMQKSVHIGHLEPGMTTYTTLTFYALRTGTLHLSDFVLTDTISGSTFTMRDTCDVLVEEERPGLPGVIPQQRAPKIHRRHSFSSSEEEREVANQIAESRAALS